MQDDILWFCVLLMSFGAAAPELSTTAIAMLMIPKQCQIVESSYHIILLV